MEYKIFHGPEAVHFVECDPNSTSVTESGQPNQETFTDEGESVARVLELDEDFFPVWDGEETYQIGDRVKFLGNVYRALQENDAREFELPDLLFNPDAEVATPANRQARWVEVYDKNYEEQSLGGPI